LKKANKEGTQSSVNNNRIAKNTAMLYFRMLLSMVISLYTSRIILEALGIEDFGIYSVVGGVVGMFTFLNTSMTSATQRFLNFELGTENKKKLNKIFNVSVLIHFFIALIVLILCESIGLWFLNTQMTIPVDRVNAAHWVFQLSILLGIVMIISVPYNAIIISNEKMSAFAYISIVDVSLKLVVAFLISSTLFDKLIYYAILLFAISLINRLIYVIYCKWNFKETKFEFIWDKLIFKKMTSFAAWSLIGNLSVGAISQGSNLLLNVFFGPMLNAARGIAVQVQNAIGGFAVNFQMAMDPQITISYAKKELKYMQSLVFNGSKYSFFLLLFISLPLLFETELVLAWWIKTIPEHTVNFLRIILLTSLIDSISHPFNTSVRATGEIRKFELVLGAILLLVVPISYVLLKFGAIPEAVFITHLVVVIIAQITRVIIVCSVMKFSLDVFINEIVFRIGVVTFFSVLIPMFLYLVLPQNWIRFLIITAACGISVSINIYWLGINTKERSLVKIKSLQFYNRVINNLK